MFALFTSRTGSLNGLPASTTSYLHKDHLGSVAAITTADGALAERLAYDPWGKRRHIHATPGKPDTRDAIVGVRTDRGYTEHEHLDEIGVIHMNGRIFDPLIGRFMSADAVIPDPFDLQSYNRYSYVENNPLRNTDPTGHESEDGGDSGDGDSGDGDGGRCSRSDYSGSSGLGGGFYRGDKYNNIDHFSDISSSLDTQTESINNKTENVATLKESPGSTFFGSLFGDNVGVLAATVSQNNVNPVTGLIENFKGDNLASKTILAAASTASNFVTPGSAAIKAEVTLAVDVAKGPVKEVVETVVKKVDEAVDAVKTTVVEATKTVQNLVFRSASGTPDSMTPRLGDVNGLSASNSLANALPGKNQVIDVSKLNNLCAVCDNPKTGHVSIMPKDPTQLQGWMNSRGGTKVHPLTKELMDAVVGTKKK